MKFRNLKYLISATIIFLAGCHNSMKVDYSEDSVQKLKTMKIKDHRIYFYHKLAGKDIKAIKLMLSAGFNPNYVKNNYFPLQLVSERGLFEMAKLLVKNGACVNLENANGETALMFAAKNNHFKIVKLLTSNNAKLDYADKKGYTALIWACMTPMCPNPIKNFESVKMLIDAGADVQRQDKHGDTALMNAAWDENTEDGYKICKYLLEHGADINMINDGKENALWSAARGNNTKIIELLLKNRANVNQVNEFGDNILLTPALMHENNTEAIKLLLNHGAKINATGNYGFTPLMKACRSYEKYDVIKLFIDKEAKVNLINKKTKMTALDYAMHYKIRGNPDLVFNKERISSDKTENQKIIDLLHKHGAKTTAELNAKQKAK